MAVKDHQRIAGIGVVLEAVRQQDVGAQVHGSAPEFAEQFALDADVFHVPGVGGWFDWRDDLIELDRDNRVGGAGPA